MRIVVVEPDKAPYEREISGSLRSMQEIVGGNIEVVYSCREDIALICNEEGVLLGFPLNRVLRDENGQIYNIISGTFFLCAAPPDGESFASLSDAQVQRYLNRFRPPECHFMFNGKIVSFPIGQ